ncbi:MAG: flagellar hook capping protein, partial [Peptococcaceae bacterium]|nr:flagellar hook capping protein [Peptococcaceae bacterium]
MAPPDSVGGIDRMLGQSRTYDAVFTDKKSNDNLKTSDFLALMVAQMKNQDFLNPMDDAQFVTQMAQFSTMQQMMELAEWSKSNYAMSLVGKTVTASRFNVSGGLDTTVGLVDRISFVDNEYVLFIEDKRYTLS